MEKMKTDFQIALEEEAGESVESLSATPISDRRDKMLAKTGKRMRILSHFPYIGRGNITTVISRNKVDADLDWALKLK